MKNFAKGMVLTIILALGLTTFTTLGYAEGEVPTDTTQTNTTDSFYDPDMGSVITPYKSTEEGLVPVSEEEYLADTEATMEVENSTIEYAEPPIVKGGPQYEGTLTYWTYSESSAVKYYGDPIAVTAGVKCTASKGCNIAKGQMISVATAYSVSANSEIKAIKAGASFTFTSTLTSTSTYGFNIAYGEEGYLAFKPYKRKTTGTLRQYNQYGTLLASKSAYGRSPIKLSNGEADGYYIFIHKDYPGL
ncbi:hypothetical protein J7E81_30145 [Bacillus sp. ISL-18]|uniref:DUF6060 domain-containing protein n=1 Tax=Bacillus sp. ISL-18 TaxID=2819118 RepID=UPI001BE843ED|nr:hypothetical protein [Bacillus sp. ISL-18]MBT2659389.1 hypothetical protein [Bacillus sp. ISL-18]